MLRYSYDTKDEIPEPFRELYTERDGKWVLEVEGAPKGESGGGGADPAKLDEFRSANNQLRQQLEEQKAEFGRFKKQFSGVDPEEFAQFRQKLDEMAEDEERKLIAQGNIEEVVKRRTAKLLEEKNTEIKNRTDAYEELRQKYDKLSGSYAQSQALTRIDALISEQGLQVRKGAKEDLAHRITQDWSVSEDGTLEPKRKDLIGETGSAMDPTEYVTKELLGKRGFFFEPASGGGSKGNDGGDGPPSGGVISRDPLSIGKNLKDLAAGRKTVSRD